MPLKKMLIKLEKINLPYRPEKNRDYAQRGWEKAVEFPVVPIQPPSPTRPQGFRSVALSFLFLDVIGVFLGCLTWETE
jgi:predicted metalloenzyme YecM